MRRFFVHSAIAVLAAFLAYKSFIALCSQLIPGQPFYDFNLYDWVYWLFSMRDLFFIGIVTLAEYLILSLVLLRLLRKKSAVAIWGAAFGIYVGVMSYPLDVVSRVDRYGPQEGALSTLLTIVEVVLIGLVLPIAMAAIIGRLSAKSSRPDV